MSETTNIAALGHQKQCDEEGVLIAVSRQAVDEAMAALRELAAERERADRNQEDAERYRWILSQATITDFIFRCLRSRERHVSNAIDAERGK